MASHGWKVVATSRAPAKLAEWAERQKVVVLPLNLMDESSIDGLVTEVVSRFGRIDALVNNSGYGIFGALEATTLAELEAYFRANLFGALTLIRHVMPVMRRQHDGTIVNVSSIGGRTAAPFASLYHGVKFALEGFSESFRYEASLHGVRIKLVEPAHFKTAFISRSLEVAHHPEYEANLDNYMEWVRKEDVEAPEPSPVARAILRAASDPSPRLRYQVKGGLILALVSLLPDSMWRSLMAEGMRRRPKVPRPR
jgi:NAD(P)-dependent dehydrogenase (short-subunit alcohol dehydrogenase family)